MKTYPPSITKEVIAGLPIETFTGKIVVVDHTDKMKKAVAHLSTADCVGFDTETRPNFSKHHHYKVSLMQIS